MNNQLHNQQGNNVPPYPPMPQFMPIVLPYDILPPEPPRQRNMQEGGYYLPSGRRTPHAGPFVLPMRVGATHRRRTLITTVCLVLAAILLISGLALAVDSVNVDDLGNLERSEAIIMRIDPTTY